jgi:parvulin-like peptidyl-prolyl isomerase
MAQGAKRGRLAAIVMSISLSLLFLFPAAIAGAEPSGGERAIVARVDGQPVTASEVQLELRRALGDRRLEGAQRAELERAALTQVIDRRLVLRYLTRTGQAASDQDVEFALAKFEKDLAAREQTLDAHLEELRISPEEFRRTLAWQLSWQRYLDKQLTDENLEKYFQRHRREFDGTELRIAQILLKLPPDADAAATAAVRQRAAVIREQIANGKLPFMEAARQHSEAPSSKQGGDVGWIERHQPMPEDISREAFGLRMGQVGEPFVTRFGVHLITVVEERAGQRTWRETAPELRRAVALYLFQWIADRERQHSEVELIDGHG